MRMYVEMKAVVRRMLKSACLAGCRAWDGVSSADISIFHKMMPPPDGGGNQFLRALWMEFNRRGFVVENNRISATTKAAIFNSFNFDGERLSALRRSSCRMVHRVDGPVDVYRGRDEGVDAGVQRLNAEYADATVFQSHYSKKAHEDVGLVFKDPLVIRNAVDPLIFNSEGRSNYDGKRKVRLFSMSWSDNVNKGSAVYRWLEDHLDWEKYEYTFVGRSNIDFKKIKMLEPQDSYAIAKMLREHDIFITASKHESCSNALIESMSCGLPALYIKSGSNAEVAGAGGLGFDDQEELPQLLDQMISNYSAIQGRIDVPSIADVASRYLEVMGLKESKRRCSNRLDQ